MIDTSKRRSFILHFQYKMLFQNVNIAFEKILTYLYNFSLIIHFHLAKYSFLHWILLLSNILSYEKSCLKKWIAIFHCIKNPSDCILNLMVSKRRVEQIFIQFVFCVPLKQTLSPGSLPREVQCHPLCYLHSCEIIRERSQKQTSQFIFA